MELFVEYVGDLTVGNEGAALWIMIGVAAAWGCLFGVTGMLAVQKHFESRHGKKDSS